MATQYELISGDPFTLARHDGRGLHIVNAGTGGFPFFGATFRAPADALDRLRANARIDVEAAIEDIKDNYDRKDTWASKYDPRDQ